MKALIIGATSQDGVYLSRFLASKGYTVFGLIRGQDNPKTHLLLELSPTIIPLEGDLLDHGSLVRTIQRAEPDELYNFGAISHVGYSWQNPILTGEITGLGVTRLLEAIRTVNPKIKVYQASTAELFGNCKPDEFPINEETPFRPRSPYAIAKLYAHWVCNCYRESYGTFVACGILFNHESPIRGEQFVTRKVTKAVAEIEAGLRGKLILGNLDAKRDWGYSKDYIEAMWLMLQQDTPEDYVICTGKTYSIQDLIRIAFAEIGISPTSYIKTSDEFKRPADVSVLLGDNTKAKDELSWTPRVGFEDLIKMMVRSDRHLVKYGKIDPELI